MRIRGTVLALAVAVLSIGSTVGAEARIRCNGPYQVVRGQGEIATPYCEDSYLARVARSYGIRVSAAVIRHNDNEKERVCRAIGHDGRVYAMCLKYRSEGCSGRRC